MSKPSLVDFQEHMPNYLSLLNATRKLGHSVETAIADLVDNGTDANATDIHVYFQEEFRTEKQLRNDGRNINAIIIVDNGDGMNKVELHHALIPASTARIRNIQNQSGFFGMGVIASGLALGNHIAIYTRGADGDLYSYLDWDEKVKNARHTDNHINASRLCTSNESAKLTNYLGTNETGTMLVITKLKTEPNKAYDMIRNVRHHLATVLYYKRDKVNIYTHGLDGQFKGSKIIWYDYLEADNTLRKSETKEFPITKDAYGNKCAEKVTLQMSWINRTNKSREFPCLQHPCDSMQGGLLVRNNRGLAKGAMLGIYEKSPINNSFRWVLKYEGGILDDYVFDMNVQKDDCTILHKELKNWIKRELYDFQTQRQKEDNERRRLQKILKDKTNSEITVSQETEKVTTTSSAIQVTIDLHPAIKELRDLVIDDLSGREALSKLYELQLMAVN